LLQKGGKKVYRKKRTFLYLLLLVVILIALGGCLNQKTTPEQMYEVMEKVVLEESTFENQQSPLVKAEKKEKQLYDQILSLGMKEHEQIVKLADEALLLVEERKTLMASETASIEKSEVQFEKLLPYIEKLEEPSLKKEAKKLYEVMIKRYRLHEDLNIAYSQALQFDKELYQLFKRNDLSMDELENQINQINEIYEKIYDINKQFNVNTEKYNDLKLVFYQKAGFKIENKQ
jgi:methyl-accepting chemotaxis protein